MRHLINKYVLADSPETLGHLEDLSLTELIIQTGIHDAIARKWNDKGRLSKKAIAEGVINNIRKTIIRDQLTDPQFYEQMSKLLDDLIKLSIKDAEAYEKFLLDAEALVKKHAEKQSGGVVPEVLKNNPRVLLLYRNLSKILSDLGLTVSEQDSPGNEVEAQAELALQIDQKMLEDTPAGWRGDEAKERTVKNILFPLLKKNPDVTKALFAFLANRHECP